MNSEKTCKKCNSVFSGRYCPACKKEIAKAYYLQNKEKINAYSMQWRKDNPERFKEINKASYIVNRDKRIQDTRDWRENNVSHIRRYAKAYNLANFESRKSTNKAWHAANPNARRTHENNRRNIKRGKLSRGLSARLMVLQRGRCACCKKPLNNKFHLDHIVPLNLGGLNEDSNIQLLLPICNMRKHKKHPIDFMQERGYLL